MSFEREFRIAEWVVKPHSNTIVGPQGEAHVEPKAMQVLGLLASHQGEVVSKQEILKAVWDGTFVSDEVLPNAIWEVRKALGDDARKPRFIQTLPKKGYRLIASVEVPGADAERFSSGGSGARKLLSWRSVPAVLLLGVVAVGALILLGEADAPGHDPFSVLVMDFENHTKDEELKWLSSGAPTMLRTGLAEVTGLTVVSSQRLEQVLNEIDANGSSRHEVARRAGASAVVVGTIFRLGPEYRIDVQIENVDDARILSAHSVRGEDVFQLMDDLTAHVRDSLRIDSPSKEPVTPIKEMTTASLDAFRLYNEGVEARRHLRVSDARRALTEAVRLDPDFALALAELQMVAALSRDEAAYRDLQQRVLELKDRLPPNQRLLLESTDMAKEDPERAETELLELIARRPDEEEAYMMLSHLYQDSREMEKSLQILERGVTNLPYSGYLRLYYGYALLKLSRFPEAIHEFEAYARINPDEANPQDSLGEAHLIAGSPEPALDYYRRALEIDPTFASSHIGRSWAFASTGRYDEALAEIDAIEDNMPPKYSRYELVFQRAYVLARAGRYREAEGLLEIVNTEALESENTTMQAAVRLLDSLFAIEKNELDAAIAEARAADVLLSAENDSPNLNRLRKLAALFEGIAASRSGKVEQAGAKLAALGSPDGRDPREQWWYHLLIGEIALSRNDPRAAFTAFDEGTPRRKMEFNVIHLFENLGGSLPFRDGAARAKALQGDYRRAVELYERLLHPGIGQVWTAMLEPRYHLELARLHRENGNAGEASKHYQRFLSLWSKADSNCPELSEAEQFLASS
ncbi:MAG TPA: winged helix-turn-helix domain-containing protein [Vicinamibacteria bacterium]|nr:winged helix-turn-helix domain-containing protein [Vicinamibacteria bacterium]